MSSSVDTPTSNSANKYSVPEYVVTYSFCVVRDSKDNVTEAYDKFANNVNKTKYFIILSFFFYSKKRSNRFKVMSSYTK